MKLRFFGNFKMRCDYQAVKEMRVVMEILMETVEENDTKTAAVSNGKVRGGRPYRVVRQG